MSIFYTNSSSPAGADPPESDACPTACPVKAFTNVGATRRVAPTMAFARAGADLRVRPTAYSTKAFTLLEIVAVLAIVGILGGTLAPLAFQLFTSKRGEVTVDKLEEFKKAIIGNPFVIGDDVRSSFGYIGDMGNLPASLQDLYIRGVQPTYSYDSNKKTGAGWRGPYINPAIIEDLAILGLDAYKQQLAYSTTAFTDTTQTGTSVVGTLTSTGPNRTQGGAVADDRNVYIFQSEAFSTVSGFLKDPQDNRLGGVSVTINYPSNGTLTSSLPYITGDDGYFTFSNIPYGNRSITIAPKLAYVSGSYQVGDFYKTTGLGSITNPEIPPDGIPDDVIFYITNYSPNPVTIRAATVYFDINVKGTPGYGNLLISAPTGDCYFIPLTSGHSGGLAKYNGSTPPIINGSTQRSRIVRVQSPQTHLPDLRIADYSTGETVRLALTDFEKGSTPLDVSGVQFKVEFYENYSGNSGTNLITTIYFP